MFHLAGIRTEQAVPTWNYAVAQVQGLAELVDPATTLARLAMQVAKYSRARSGPCNGENGRQPINSS
ncbi:FMN-binding negative transcriptional regulator [Alishewanella longhuensis]